MFGQVRVNRVVASIVDLLQFTGFQKIDLRQSTPNSAGL
jgi:hypothetical protein